MGEEARTVTRLIEAWREGERGAADALLSQVYDELHRIAAGVMRNERAEHTLQPTALLSEAYLRLSGGALPQLSDRVHFFAIASRTMRQVLVDHARKRATAKRGSAARAVPLDDVDLATTSDEQILALHEALEKLLAFDERRASAVELRYFGGLTQPEIADVLGVHVNTVAADLKFGEAWLHRAMTST